MNFVEKLIYYRVNLLTWIVFYGLSFCLYGEYQVRESDVFHALKGHIQELRGEKKYRQVIDVLSGFEKKFPASVYLKEIWLQKAEVLMVDLKKVEKGFYYLEKSEKMFQHKKNPQINLFKKKYGVEITLIRLKRLNYFIEQFFIQFQKFPENLNHLMKIFPEIKKNYLKDGFGYYFQYELYDNELMSGADQLFYRLYSTGPDGVSGTEDEIFLTFSSKPEVKTNVNLVDSYEFEGRWMAEIEYYDEKKKSLISKKVEINDSVYDFFVYGISENGVILLKDNEPLVLKK